MESVGSDDIGLVIPLLVAINPLEVDVHVDVVVALQIQNLRLTKRLALFFFFFRTLRPKIFVCCLYFIHNYLPLPDVPFPVVEPFPFPT